MAAKKSTGTSVRHALDTEELQFCRIFVAFGRKNKSEAYRRAYLVKNDDGDWFERDKQGEPRLDKPVDSKQAQKRANALLRLEHISSYLEEIMSPAGDHARQTLGDAVLYGDEPLALKAAEKVLQEEDKLGFRDAVEQWAEYLCAVGADAVLGVTDQGEVVVPLKAMFPQFKDATPPDDVLEKTIKTLEAMRSARKDREAEAVHGNVRQLAGEGEGEVPSPRRSQGIRPPDQASHTPTTTKEVKVNFRDIVEGRAYIRLSFVSKLLLCHWAGAPWSDKDSKAFLSALQGEVLSRREREKIVHGGSGLGKSVLGGCDLTVAAMLPFRKIAVVADTYAHVSHEFAYLYKAMKHLFRDHSQAFKTLAFRSRMNYHDYDCDTVWGTRAIGISTQTDEGAQLLGREFTDAVCGEASHIAETIFNKKLLRALDRSTMAREHGLEQECGTLSLYTTPDGYAGASAYEWERIRKATKNQPELLHYGRVPWARTVWVREASVMENPGYSRDTFETRRAEAQGDAARMRAFEEQYLGKMTYASGRVWRSFMEDKHVRPLPSADYIRRSRLGLGIDTGACTGILLLAIGPDGKKWVLGESYLERPPRGIFASLDDTESMLQDVLAVPFETDVTSFLIQEALFLLSIDPASQHKLEIVDHWDCGLTSPNTADTRSVIRTIDLVESWFANDELFIADTCDHLIDQIRKYVWKTYKAPKGAGVAPVVREPQKGFDHLCDALRIGLVPLSEYGPLDEPPPVVNFVDAWNQKQRDALFGPLKRAMDPTLRHQDEDTYRV